MLDLKARIERYFDEIATIRPGALAAEVRADIAEVMTGLGAGVLRAALPGDWAVQEWVKKAILLHFRAQALRVMPGECSNFFDKIALKYAQYERDDFVRDGVRVVPPAYVREGVFVAENCVLMPCYVNIGAYIDSGSMIDIWATIGSCAQIGKRVHISGNACIGGVLEPLQASPVIIEDDCFVGAGAIIVEGVIVERGAVIAAGVRLGQSTRIYERETGKIYIGRVPSGAVVVPGSLPSTDGKYSLECAIIVKKVDAGTLAKTSINQILREVAHAN